MNSQYNAVYGCVLNHLIPYFKYYMKFNKGINNPYHNLNHTLRIMNYIYDACYTHLVGRDEHYDAKGLFLGALYHDFNHSGGKLDDSYNIRMAIQGLKDADKWVLENYGKYYKVPTSVRKRAINYIKATQYPYVIDDDKLNKNQALIRDCDILCYFADDWFSQVLVGLATELDISDYNEALDKMEKFLEDSFILSRTKYAECIFKSNLNRWKKEKDYYIKNILK